MLSSRRRRWPVPARRLNRPPLLFLSGQAVSVVASLVNRTQRQRLVPRDLLGRVTSTVRVLFLAVDPLGVVAAGAATVALGGDPRPVFLVAGITVVVAAAGGWAGGLRAASGHPVRRGQGPA
jgi:hypothetical protein